MTSNSAFQTFSETSRGYLIAEKKVGEKWLNFLQVTKFFPDEIFPNQYFSPIFFSTDKEFIPIFFLFSIIIIFSYLFAKFIITMIFWCTLFIVVEQSIFNKISKFEWKQGIEKNNSNDINTTRNWIFVNFKNYTTLKTSKRIGFKLVLIISRSKERVFNSFKDFVWFFDRLCYPRWFKAIQNQITAPSQVLVHLIDPFCV